MYKQLILSISGSVISIGHLIIAAETRNILAWVFGFVVGYYAIRASRAAHMASKASQAASKAAEQKALAELKALQEQNRPSKNN